jgi:mersacidin/lichenicidin family type 2 lantibiotic
MSTNEMIVRAWKDPKFRAELKDAGIPASPVGEAEVNLIPTVGDAFITNASICTNPGSCTLCPAC